MEIDYNYRIIIETERSGKEWFYVQERKFLFFWDYLTEAKGLSTSAYKIGWLTLDDAKKHLHDHINSKYEKSQKRIAGKKVVYYCN